MITNIRDMDPFEWISGDPLFMLALGEINDIDWTKRWLADLLQMYQTGVNIGIPAWLTAIDLAKIELVQTKLFEMEDALESKTI